MDSKIVMLLCVIALSIMISKAAPAPSDPVADPKVESSPDLKTEESHGFGYGYPGYYGGYGLYGGYYPYYGYGYGYGLYNQYPYYGNYWW